MYFLNFGVPKTCLDKYLKSILSEDTLTSNTVNEPKHFCILDERTFTIFIEHCEGN